MAAARELLTENGGSRFSLAEVAARSGKNIALVSYHFGGKEQMLVAIATEDEVAVTQPLQALLAADLPVLVKLERHLRGLVELHARRPYFNALIHELLRRSDAATRELIIEKVIRPMVAFQKALLEQGQAEGVFRPVDPFAFYLNVVGGVDMLFAAQATVELGFGERSDDSALRERFVRATLALVLDGMRAPPPHAGPE
jgi:TetR/AcrR family transcriptional regulator